MSFVAGIIGFVIGIAFYGANRGESELVLLYPIVGVFVGGMTGIVIDKLMQSAKDTNDKKPIMRALFVLSLFQ